MPRMSSERLMNVEFTSWLQELITRYIFFSALIQLKLPINIEDENKAQICLPDDDNPIAEDRECYVTGCGVIEYDGYPNRLLAPG